MLLNTVGHWIKLDQSLRKSPTLCSFIFLCLCWVLVPWPHGSVFPLLHLCCFFLPFRIRIGHPWNYQASSCLISCVKLKLPLWPPHRLTWLQPCGSVNVRISESGKKISCLFLVYWYTWRKQTTRHGTLIVWIRAAKLKFTLRFPLCHHVRVTLMFL